MSRVVRPLSDAERYLDAWHARHPDATSVFGDLRDAYGRSSYDRLARLDDAERAVLDLACGAGPLLALIDQSRVPRALHGVDLCLEELHLASTRVPSAALVQCRAQALPFADDSVQVVACHMALMLMDDTEAVLGECQRVLQRGGRLAAILANATEPDPLVSDVLRALGEMRPARDQSRLPPPLGDSRTRDPDGLRRLLSRLFDDVRVEPFTVSGLVTRGELWPTMARSVYGLDAVSDADGAALVSRLDLPDAVRWTVTLLQAEGRARG